MSTKDTSARTDQIETIAARAVARGEKPFDVNQVIDRVVAPMVYHILFGDRELSAADCRKLVAGVSSLA